jgi:hypothetical protein
LWAEGTQNTATTQSRNVVRHFKPKIDSENKNKNEKYFSYIFMYSPAHVFL